MPNATQLYYMLRGSGIPTVELYTVIYRTYSSQYCESVPRVYAASCEIEELSTPYTLRGRAWALHRRRRLLHLRLLLPGVLLVRALALGEE